MTDRLDVVGTGLDRRELGGDPPCWEGLVTDHRDPVPPEPAAPIAPMAQPAPSSALVPGVGDRGDAAGRPDLATPTDVHDLVVAFYREIVFDELLEPVFGEVAEVDWAEHIPKLIDYWCWILFGAKRYAGAVTKTHRHLHGMKAIEPQHCDRWYQLWAASIDGRWTGPTAEHAKHHAESLMAGLAKHVFGFTWTSGTAAAPAG